ncbi:hypothetical protein SAMN05444162_2900 [Paenibacillaceae bacterium GAS479]|nr:hypothetical protein SAMN05444162_2900 [Paenibacillaceae bacterium GAS479]
MFQSTLPHGERHVARLKDVGFSNVSIHAPARGATAAVNSAPQAVRVSIHAPARGATRMAILKMLTGTLFQSTLPHGERLLTQSAAVGDQSFNPRSRTGSDSTPEKPLLRLGFQPQKCEP